MTEGELQQLVEQYNKIHQQYLQYAQTVSPTNPYGTNPQKLRELQAKQSEILGQIHREQQAQTKASKKATLQQKAQEQEQRAQEQYRQEADEFNQQLAEERAMSQPQSDKTRAFFKDQQAQDYGEFLNNEILSSQAKWDAKQKAKAAQQTADDDAFFNSTGVYERYAAARRRLNSLNPIQRLFHPDNKFVKEFEERYKRKFGKDVNKSATDQFYNDYSMPNVATDINNVAAKMKQLTEQWYGEQIDKMAEQYTAGQSGGTLEAVNKAWQNALSSKNASGEVISNTPDQILDRDTIGSVDPADYTDVFSKGPDAVYKWFRDLFFDYYNVTAYAEWLQEMVNNGQFQTYQKGPEQMEQAKDILQNKIPSDKQDYEQNIQVVASDWNTILSAVVRDNTYKRNDVEWGDKGGGHGTGFMAPIESPAPAKQGPRGYIPAYVTQ